ncbi:MAG: U32 family peptidase, partial [Bacilli bacterium]
MKIVILPKNLNDLDKFKADIVIVGIDKLSWYIPFVINKRNFKSTINLINKSNKQVFIAVNKLMTNSDLSLLKSYLKLINNNSVVGILFDDPAVYQLCSKTDLSIPLIHFSSHLITNYQTADFWLKKGLNGVLLSTEITLDEILSIRSQTSTPLLMQGYGYLPMFVSRRNL